MMKSYKLIFSVLTFVSILVFASKESSAVPAFARKYHTACATCHLAFPVRNAFGEAFRNNGYRFPEGKDEEMVKETPIQLGSEAYKNVFPDAIYPSDIPNMPSLGFLGATEIASQKNRKDWLFDQELGVFFAGTVGEAISYFGDFGVNPNDGATLGRLCLIWAFAPGINFVVGDVGFPELFTLISAKSNADGGTSYSVSLPNPNKGVEIRIAGDAGIGGYSLVAGIGRNNMVPSNLGDMRFVRATYKPFGSGLLSGSGGVLGNQVIGLDNAVTFGVSFFNSTMGAVAADLPGLSKTAYSADLMANYGSFRAVAQIAGFNEVIDGDPGSPNFNTNTGKRTQLSLEGDYWVYPWLFGVLRYERIKDNLNGEITKVIPGVAALLRVNAKLGMEYVAYTKESSLNTFHLFAQLGF